MGEIEYRTVGDREKRALLKGRLGTLEQQHFQLVVVGDVAAAAGLTAEVERLEKERAEIGSAISVVTGMLDALPPEDPDNPDPNLRMVPSPSAGVRR